MTPLLPGSCFVPSLWSFSFAPFHGRSSRTFSKSCPIYVRVKGHNHARRRFGISNCANQVPPDSRFCPSCASKVVVAKPPGDEHERLVCSSQACGRVIYKSPNVTVASVIITPSRKQVLLAKRAIDPAIGKWNIPGGFLENRESLEDGVVRETQEETGASIHVLDLLGVYSIVAAGQVQLVYLSVLLEEAISPGPESEECALFTWGDVPWDDLAFTTHKWALLRALNHIMSEDPSSPLLPELRTKPLDYSE